MKSEQTVAKTDLIAVSQDLAVTFAQFFVVQECTVCAAEVFQKGTFSVDRHRGMEAGDFGTFQFDLIGFIPADAAARAALQLNGLMFSHHREADLLARFGFLGNAGWRGSEGDRGLVVLKGFAVFQSNALHDDLGRVIG